MSDFGVWLSVALEDNQAFPSMMFKDILKPHEVKCLLWFQLSSLSLLIIETKNTEEVKQFKQKFASVPSTAWSDLLHGGTQSA